MAYTKSNQNRWGRGGASERCAPVLRAPVRGFCDTVSRDESRQCEPWAQLKVGGLVQSRSPRPGAALLVSDRRSREAGAAAAAGGGRTWIQGRALPTRAQQQRVVGSPASLEIVQSVLGPRPSELQARPAEDEWASVVTQRASCFPPRDTKDKEAAQPGPGCPEGTQDAGELVGGSPCEPPAQAPPPSVLSPGESPPTPVCSVVPKCTVAAASAPP